MNRHLQILLGVLTAIGGFVDVGNIVTSAQAGSKFGFSLIWALLVGTVCIIFVLEAVGRLAAMGDKAYADILREKFGFRFALIPLGAELAANFLLLAAELGGAAFALYLVTGISFKLLIAAMGIFVWAFLWFGNFKMVEDIPSLLGLVALSFAVAVIVLGAPWGEVAARLVAPDTGGRTGQYFLIAAAIIASIISPYLIYFYSSGAREEGWTHSMVRTNRIIAVIGMAFGATAALSILIVSAVALKPAGIEANDLQTVGLGLVQAFGKAGVYLFAGTLFVCCFGAALEISLAIPYEITQVMGWRYGVGPAPADTPMFHLIFLIFIAICTMLMFFSNINPLQLTLYAMMVTALVLPFHIVPFIAVMNDPEYLQDQTNNWFASTAVLLVTAVAFVLSIVSIPLILITGG